METVYTDGSFLISKDKGGAGVFFETRGEFLWSGPWSNTTTNRMELLAIYMTVKFISEEGGECVIFSDSKYCVDTINMWWKKWDRERSTHRRPNFDLWKDFFDLYKGDVKRRIKVEWVKGHSNNHGNDQADMMATKMSAKNDNIKEDNRNGFTRNFT